MSYFQDQNPGGNGRDQNFYYNDGNTQMHYNSRQLNWSSSQSINPNQSPPLQLHQQPQLFPPPMQSPALTDFSQLQQSHVELHQASMQSALDMHKSMTQTMQQPIFQSAPQPRSIQYVQSPPQIQYMQSPQTQYIESPPRMQDVQSSPEVVYVYPPPPAKQDTALATRQLEQYHARDDERRKELIRETKKVDSRLQRLEESHAKNREQHEAKDRELAAARAREQQLQEQLLKAEQSHNRAMVEMAAAQAAATQPTTPALDMAALRKVIDEVQKDKISKDDIKQLVGDAVQAQLAGVAKSSDIDSAASRMEKGLNKLLASAPIDQIQGAVQRELEKAIRKVSKKMPMQQQMIDGPQQFQDRAAWQPTVQQEQPRNAAPYQQQLFSGSEPNDTIIMTTTISLKVPQPRGNAGNDLGLGPSQAVPSPPGISREGLSKSHDNNAMVSFGPQGTLNRYSSSIPTAQQARIRHPVSSLQPSQRMQIEAASSTTMPVRYPSIAVAENALVPAQQVHRKHHKSRKSLAVSDSQSTALVPTNTNLLQGLSRFPRNTELALARNPHQQTYNGAAQNVAALSGEFTDNLNPSPTWQMQPAPTRQLTYRPNPTTGNNTYVQPGQGPLLQIEAAPQQSKGSMALVKQSKDLARRS